MKVNGKAIHVQAYCGTRSFPGSLGSEILRKSAHEGVKLSVLITSRLNLPRMYFYKYDMPSCTLYIIAEREKDSKLLNVLNLRVRLNV